jgi:hypothetical protein
MVTNIPSAINRLHSMPASKTCQAAPLSSPAKFRRPSGHFKMVMALPSLLGTLTAQIGGFASLMQLMSILPLEYLCLESPGVSQGLLFLTVSL